MTKRQVGTIIRAHAKGEKPQTIAQRVGVHVSAVREITALAQREMTDLARMRALLATAKEETALAEAQASAKRILARSKEVSQREWRKT